MKSCFNKNQREKKKKKRKEKLANYLTNQGNYFSLSVGQLAVGLANWRTDKELWITK